MSEQFTLSQLLASQMQVDRNIARDAQDEEMRVAIAKVAAMGKTHAVPKAYETVEPSASPNDPDDLDQSGEALAALFPDEDEGDDSGVTENGQTGSDGLDQSEQIGDSESVGSESEDDPAIGDAGEGQSAERLLTDEAPAPVVSSPWEADAPQPATRKVPKAPTKAR